MEIEQLQKTTDCQDVNMDLEKIYPQKKLYIKIPQQYMKCQIRKYQYNWHILRPF